MTIWQHVVRGGVAMMAVVLVAGGAWAQDDATSARTWLDRAGEIETDIREAEVVSVEDIGTGVTNPKRATLASGGLIEEISFKPLRPGRYRGYWESYKAEVAAYELDKLLGLGLIPPTVEKRVEGDLGAAAMWVSPVKSFRDFGEPPTPPSTEVGRWSYQLIKAKMFHNLIANKDPNLGNWLVDPQWNLILIDNSRAFTTEKKMVHKLTRIDWDLWDRMLALDEASLTPVLAEWLSDGEIRAIVERRDLMAEDIRELVDEFGEARVFVRFKGVPYAAPSGARSAPLEPGDLHTLTGRLVDALNETPVVLPSSGLNWIGRVVLLDGYGGGDDGVARQAVEAGYRYGLVTSEFGLVCLTPDRYDAAAYGALDRLMTDELVEVFGVSQDEDGMTVLQVMRARFVH